MEIKNLKNIFIHKTLRTNIEEYGKANILLYIMLTTTFFASSYAIYYEITNDNIHIIKHISNIVDF